MQRSTNPTARNVEISPELIGRLAERPIVVVSPHFDDACFSIGCLLERLQQGLLINVFTRSIYAPGEPKARDEVRVHDIRTAEDIAFAKRCSLNRIELLLEEPALRSLRPNDPAGIADGIRRATAPLLAALDQARAHDGGKGRLLVPMGIGRHANHLATAQIIETNLARLSASYEVLFYEDLPYAHHPLHRFRALKSSQRLRRGLRTRYVLPVSWKRKRELVALYPSQFRRAPGPLRFRPAALVPLAVHEAFWSANGIGL